MQEIKSTKTWLNFIRTWMIDRPTKLRNRGVIMNSLQKYISRRKRMKATQKLAKQKLAENQRQWTNALKQGQGDYRMERD